MIGAMFDPERVKAKIRDVQDFPTAGVVFKDIAPVFEDAELLRHILDAFVDAFRDRGADKVLGIDARGFLLAAPLAYLLNTGVVMARKKGKLPRETVRRAHALEYGKGHLEVHTDAIAPGERVLVLDDVLATGGTASAAVELVKALNGELAGLGFLIELSALGGREKLAPHTIESLIIY